MSLVKKPCRICGKLYTPCSYCEHENTAFHWRAVACSRECAAEYFRRVTAARDKKNGISESSNNLDGSLETQPTENSVKTTVIEQPEENRMLIKKNRKSKRIDVESVLDEPKEEMEES